MNAISLSELHIKNDTEIESWHDFWDLRVPLTIELGRARLTVQGVLDLQLQSIIQLQRSTGEGVNVMVANHCVARGEIIMIEDRTGIRVSEVIMPNRK
jgi:flagellar motor switch protein FliN/FliY